MGHPKKLRKQYETPTHPWQSDRIKEEAEYTKEYGFKNKKEIWKLIAKLKKSKEQVKKIIANKQSLQMQKEKEQLVNKLLKYGLITKDSRVEDILDLSPTDLMERRLQTIVFRKKLARSLKQARQFITHGHILLNDKKITVPSYLVFLEEESKIKLNLALPLSKDAILKKDKKIKKIIPKKEIEKVPTALELVEKIEKVPTEKLVEEKIEKPIEKIPTALELKINKEENKK